MKTRSVPSTFTSERVRQPPGQPRANMSATIWPRKSPSAAWPISILTSNEEPDNETGENNHAKTIRNCTHHHAPSAPADVRDGGGLHAPRDRRAKTLRYEQRAEQGFLWRGIRHGEAHRGPGLALRLHL